MPPASFSPAHMDPRLKNRFSLIKECDVLIDGKFVDSLKDLNLKWKGSSNQRVIDIKKSLEKNEVIEYI